MNDGNTPVNALVGGVAAVVLSMVPLSPVLGGAVAGYLQGGSSSDGLRVGVLAGVVAAVPFAVGGLAFLLWGAFLVGFGGAGHLGSAFVLALVVLTLVASAAYTVGLSAAGGWLGNYVRYDTDLMD